MSLLRILVGVLGIEIVSEIIGENMLVASITLPSLDGGIECITLSQGELKRTDFAILSLEAKIPKQFFGQPVRDPSITIGEIW